MSEFNCQVEVKEVLEDRDDSAVSNWNYFEKMIISDIWLL